MATGEGKAAWGLDQQASDEPSTPQTGQARSRWGIDIPDDLPDQAEPATSDEPLFPQPAPAVPPEEEPLDEVLFPLPPKPAEPPEVGDDEVLFPLPPKPAEPPEAAESAAPEAELFSALPSLPPVTFPLPRMQLDTEVGKERWERSHSWLEHLEEIETPAEIAETNAQEPEKPHRTMPVPGRVPHAPANNRRRVLLIALAVLVVAVVVVVSVPGLRAGALSLLPSSHTPAATAKQGTLIVHSNVAGATVTAGSTHTEISEKDQSFWSVSVPLDAGTYTVTVSAPNYSEASGQVQITANQTQIATAFLSLSPDFLAAPVSPLNHIAGQPLAQGVQPGEQYTGGQLADQPLTVTIGYRVVSILDKPEPSVLKVGNVAYAPITPLSGVITPDVVFTASDGTSVGEYLPDPLPSANFQVSLNVLLDASGQPSFGLGNPAVSTAVSGTGTPLNAPGLVNADPALLFALTRASLTQGDQASDFTCIGLVDALNGSSQPDPEDGLMMGQINSTAHYFYRWGQLWTTNFDAQALTPDLPQASDDTLVVAQSLIDAQANGLATGCK